ncbi:MAG: hypothetical protein NTX88_12100 [Candidatus Atribacteria bacterium]|nr:hypothetical protein [Candidatus Atribacteria bacterium]
MDEGVGRGDIPPLAVIIAYRTPQISIEIDPCLQMRSTMTGRLIFRSKLGVPLIFLLLTFSKKGRKYD